MTKRDYLICYDIAEPRRLARVHRYISRRAHAVQYSVYLAHCTRREIKAMIEALATLIEPKADDLRIYPLTHPLHLTTLGRPSWPQQIGLFLQDSQLAGTQQSSCRPTQAADLLSLFDESSANPDPD